MPAKKKPKVSDSNNPHHRKTKNHKTKQKSNSIDSLSQYQISFLKAKYLSLFTEIFISYTKHQTGYKKIGTLTHDLIAADIVLQYLEKHNMQLTFQNAILESSKDLKRKFTDIWIARKLQIRGKHDIIHGLVLAKKNNKFNVGFHGVIGNKNSSTNNLNNNENTNQKQKNIRISKNESNDSIKLLNVRVIEHKNDQYQLKQSSSNDTQKTLKKRRKKNSQQHQENEQDLIDQPKSTKGNSKKNSKIISDEDQAKNYSKKRRKLKKDDMNNSDSNDDNENNIKQQQNDFLHIESPSYKNKVNIYKNDQQPILKNYDDNNNYDGSDNNDDIDLDELPPPLGTDSSDDNGELFGMNDQYNYDDSNRIKNKKESNFNDELFDKSNDFNNSFNNENTYLKERFNNKSTDFNNRNGVKKDEFDDKFNKKNKFFDDEFDDKKGNLSNKLDNKKKLFDDRFNDRNSNFEDNYHENNYVNPNNQKKVKKESKNGKTRNKSIGSNTHVHTNSGQNSNNINKTKQKPENHLNDISHFYTYTYEEEDEYSESTQYEYPTHIQYEDLDEEEDELNSHKVNINNNYNKNSYPNKNPIFAHEDSLITGEIEIQSQEIDHLNPILAPISNSIENTKNKNKVIRPSNSCPSSGSPQNHSTSSNSPHEQKIKLTLQQNVDMIQNSPLEENKQPKLKDKLKTKSNENSEVQEDEPSIKEIQLVFETFHTVDVQPDPEKQRLFKLRKGKQRQKEVGNTDSPRNNAEQIYFPIQNNNQSNSKLKESQPKKIQQAEPIQKNTAATAAPNAAIATNNNASENVIIQNPVNIHIKIVEAVIFKDSGFESNVFKVRIKLASAREFAETRESAPSALKPLPDTNQLIAHHVWDESFKIFCTSTNSEEINVSVLALRSKKQQKQPKTFDIVSTAKIALKSFVIDEISDVWINMKNIGRIHLLVCIKNYNPNEDEYEEYNEEEEEEEEAEMSEDGNDGLNKDFVTRENVEYDDDNEEENEND